MVDPEVRSVAETMLESPVEEGAIHAQLFIKMIQSLLRLGTTIYGEIKRVLTTKSERWKEQAERVEVAVNPVGVAAKMDDPNLASVRSTSAFFVNLLLVKQPIILQDLLAPTMRPAERRLPLLVARNRVLAGLVRVCIRTFETIPLGMRFRMSLTMQIPMMRLKSSSLRPISVMPLSWLSPLLRIL
jgi:hypothetical protein